MHNDQTTSRAEGDYAIEAALILLDEIKAVTYDPHAVYRALSERIRDDGRANGHIMCAHVADALAAAIIRLGQ